MAKSWKNCERASAVRWGGKRIPITGRTRGSTPDHTDYRDKYAIEHKSRKALPGWLLEAIDQADASVKQPWHVPVVIVHKDRTSMDDDLVVFKRSVFERMVDPMVCPPGEEDETDEAKA